ncbi:hypothetical protein [Kribbella sp. NPDC023855]|uniref:hypothetical protein n=1 Tax=Kribbella sp. NPDC023855 TaxID=3154698 RepID=UPI00340E051E
MIGAAVIAAIGGLLGGIAAFSKDEPAQKTDDNTSSVGGDGCIAVGPNSQCSTKLNDVLRDGKISDADFKQKLAPTSTAPPTGNGPYLFVVIDTADLGLKVRSGPRAKDQQIGTSANRTVVWADCEQKSDFDPDPSLDTGPRWLKIHWPNKTPGGQFFNSEPGAPAQGWVHRGYVIPAGHNGNIKPC